mgnify:CR=1 FL=1
MSAGNAAQEEKPVYLSDCTRCGAQLRIVDDLPAETDISKSFQKGVTESFVVVPHKEEDSEKPGLGANDSQATWVAPFEKVGEWSRSWNLQRVSPSKINLFVLNA